jgi:cytochrome P450
MNQSPRVHSGPLQDPHSTPLEELDVSDPRLFETDGWRPYFERLRREDPVHYLADSPFGPFWSVTKFDDIVHVDTHHQVFSSSPTIVIGDLTDDLKFDNFIFMDPPKHDVQRAAVQPVVAPANLAKLEPVIRERAGRILDSLPVGEQFDWGDRVSIELTTQMLATLFDFPFEERRKLTRWSDLAVATPELAGAMLVTQQERVAGLQECLATFAQLWQERLGREPGYDLISLLQASEHTRDMVNQPMEFLGNLLLLIVGGNDTTRNSITGGVLALNQNPAEYAKLRGNPGLIPGMVSEIIRWQTPLAHMRRRAKEDTELGGKRIQAEDKVVMWYVSGNRDDEVIERADEFIIDRPKARHHLSFGFGIHRCMGNRLAEMQLRIVWEEINKRFRLVEVMDEPVRIRSNFVKGYESLPVRLHAA